MTRLCRVLAVGTGSWLLLSAVALAQSSADLIRAIPALGDFDYAVRTEASRTFRRADAATAVPALIDAANRHEDSYVQFRAAVLLYGFGGIQTEAFFRAALDSPNDRIRAVAYDYAEHAPDPRLVPKLLTALDRETSEFVRPALVRALAAHDDDTVVRARLLHAVDQGEGYFRGGVIEALGDYVAVYAVEPLVRIASERGPLRDDALLALGKIGDKRALAVVSAAQAEAAGSESESGDDAALLPIVSATACLLDTDCPNQIRYVVDALTYGATTDGGDQALLRGAATAAAALAMAGREGAIDALNALFDVGIGAADPGRRAPIALALGTVALRTPERVRAVLMLRDDLDASLLLLRDAFDMLDEDMPEERFFVLMRGSYWNESETPQARAVAEAVMQVLEF